MSGPAGAATDIEITAFQQVSNGRSVLRLDEGGTPPPSREGSPHASSPALPPDTSGRGRPRGGRCGRGRGGRLGGGRRFAPGRGAVARAERLPRQPRAAERVRRADRRRRRGRRGVPRHRAAAAGRGGAAAGHDHGRGRRPDRGVARCSPRRSTTSRRSRRSASPGSISRASATTSSTRARPSCCASRTAAVTRSDGCADPARPYEGAAFQYLSANAFVTATGEPLLPPYAIHDVQGVRIGFIGMTLEGTPDIVSQQGVAGLEFRDEADTANQYAAELQAQGVADDRRAAAPGRHADRPDAYDINGCNGLTGPIVDIAAADGPTPSTSSSAGTPTRRTTASSTASWSPARARSAGWSPTSTCGSTGAPAT